MRWLVLAGLLSCQSNPISQVKQEVYVEAPVSMIDAGVIDSSVDRCVLPAHQNILLIGDSQVRFLSWYWGRANVQRPNETVWFDSKPGTTILTWNHIFIREMKKYPDVDVVLIFLGTNNFNFPFLQEHQNILNEVQRRKIMCLWIGPSNVRWPGIRNLHMTGPSLKAAVSPTCTYFDTEAADIELVDGIHPSLIGAKKWLQLIWQEKDKL